MKKFCAVTLCLWVFATAASATEAPTTAPSVTAPTGSGNGTQPSFAWSNVDSATFYELWTDDLSTGTSQVIHETDLTDTTFTPAAALPDNNSFRVWVRAGNDGGWGPWSSGSVFATGNAPIAAPTGTPTITAPTGSGNITTPTLAWTDVSAETYFDVWIDDLTTGQSQIYRNQQVTGTSVTLTTALPDNSSFNVYVRAGNPFGFGPWSNPQAFGTGTGPVAPPTSAPMVAAPTGSGNTTTPTVAWTDGPEEMYFDVWIDDLTTGQSQIYRNQQVTGTTVTLTTALPDNSSFNVYVRAGNPFGFGPWSNPQAFGTGTGPVAAPTGTPTVTAPSGSDNPTTPTLTWTDVSEETYFDVWIDDLTNGQSQIYRNQQVTGTSVTLTTALPDNSSFNIYIRAGNPFGFGPWSNPQAFGTGTGPVAPPTGTPTVTAPTGSGNTTTPALAWTDVTGETFFDVWIDDLTTGQSQIYRNQQVVGTTLTLTTALPDNSSFKIYVRAGNAYGSGPWSNPQPFGTGSAPVAAPSAAPTITAPRGTGNPTTSTITWTAVAGESWADVWIDNVSTGQSQVYRNQQVAGTSLTLTTALPDNTSFNVYVRAANAFGSGPWSAAQAFGTGTGPAAPPTAAPTVTAPTGSGNATTPTITWTTVVGQSWADVWIDDLTTGQSQIFRNQQVFGTSITLTTALPDNSSFNVYLRAGNGFGFGPWSAPQAFGTGTGPVAPPTGVPVISQPNGSGVAINPTFAWSSVNNATVYDLWVDDITPGATASQVVRQSALSTTGFTATTALTPLHTFRTWVRAGNVFGFAGWSAPVDFTTASPLTITPPANIVVAATDGNGALVNYNSAVVADAADPNPVVTYSRPSGTQFPNGTTSVAITATDIQGSIATAQFTVQVVALSISPPSDISVSATNANGTVVNYPQAVVKDVLDNAPTVTYSMGTGTVFPLGTTTVLVQAVDAFGNHASANFHVTVSPLTLAPMADVTATATDPTGATVTYPPATVTDLVDPAPLVTYSQLSGTVFPIGTTLVTVAATDAQGYSASTSFNVIVNSPITITPPQDISVVSTGNDSAVVTYDAAIVVDPNDPNPTVTYTQASGTSFSVGVNTVFITVTDASGITAEASFNITVTSPITITPPADITVQATGNNSAVVTFGSATVVDASDPAPVVTYSQNSGTSFPVGATLVTINLTDAQNNTASAFFFVTVTSPLTVTAPADVFASATDANGAVVTFAAASATDSADPSPVITYSQNSGTQFPVGTTTVTATATDIQGNTASATFNVFVNSISITAPSDITVQANANNAAVVNYQPAVVLDVLDPAPVVSYSQNSGKAFPLGTTTVSIVATDAAGNSATAFFNVTVLSLISITPPADVTAQASSINGATVQLPAAVIADPLDPAPVVSYEPASGSTFTVGTTTVTVAVKDKNGNTAVAYFNVDVASTLSITPPDDILVQATGQDGAIAYYPPASVSDTLDPEPFLTYSQASNTLFPIGTNTVNVTAIDAAGNVAGASFNVIVLPPLTLTPPDDIVVQATSAQGALVNYPAVTFNDTVDQNPAFTYSLATGSTFPIGTTTVSVSAQDQQGNVAATSFNVTVVSPLQLLPVSDITQNATMQAGAAVTYTATVIDPIDPHPTITYSLASGSVFPIGTTTVTVSVADLSGASASETFNVTVISPLTITPPADLTVAATSAGGATVSFTAATVTDPNDPSPVITYSQNSNTVFPIGSTPVVVTAMDAAGFTGSATFNVTVTALQLQVPTDIVTRATANNAAIVNFAATTSDYADPNPMVTYSPASGAAFPVGLTSVYVTAIDNSGNTAQGTFNIRVLPAINIITADGTAEATGPDGAPVHFASPQIYDAVDSPTTVTFTPADGSKLPLGQSLVYVSVSDAAGNSAMSSFHLTVQDTTPPDLTVYDTVAFTDNPDGTTIWQGNAYYGQFVTYKDATATDLVSATPNIQYDWDSGSWFYLGDNWVDVTAMDEAGNISSKDFIVTVLPRTLYLGQPQDIVVQSTGPDGATVDFPEPIAYLATSITYSTNSGSVFPIGTTPVTITATDDQGDVSSATFNVTVLGDAPTIVVPASIQLGDLGSQNWYPIQLDVLGDDPGGESSLTYTWTITQQPHFDPFFQNAGFDDNGTNSAKHTTGYINKAGTYTFEVVVKNQQGLAAVSSTTITIDEFARSIEMPRINAFLYPGDTFQFSVFLFDQFFDPMSNQPAPIWSTTGGGTIGSSGIYTAGSDVGTWQVTATVPAPGLGYDLIATTNVTVELPPPEVTVAITSSLAFTGEQDVPITADAQSMNGTITKVEYFIQDGSKVQKLGEAYSPPYLYTFPDALPGFYQIFAKATDSNKKTATSDPVTIAVKYFTFDLGQCQYGGGYEGAILNNNGQVALQHIIKVTGSYEDAETSVQLWNEGTITDSAVPQALLTPDQPYFTVLNDPNLPPSKLGGMGEIWYLRDSGDVFGSISYTYPYLAPIAPFPGSALESRYREYQANNGTATVLFEQRGGVTNGIDHGQIGENVYAAIENSTPFDNPQRHTVIRNDAGVIATIGYSIFEYLPYLYITDWNVRSISPNLRVCGNQDALGPFYWENGTATILPNPKSAYYAPIALNDKPEIIGVASGAFGPLDNNGILWKLGADGTWSYTNLGFYSASINCCGEIVGSLVNPQQQASIIGLIRHHNGSVQQLQPLQKPFIGLFAPSAHASQINNIGDILVRDSGAFFINHDITGWYTAHYALMRPQLHTPKASIEITSPTDGTTLDSAVVHEINIVANPQTTSGTITKVQFFDGFVMVGEVSQAPWEMEICNPTAGDHELTARIITSTGESVRSCEVTVTVSDKAAPSIIPVSDLTIEATSKAGAKVFFNAAAIDDTDPAPQLTYSPPSGSQFPLGLTTVTITATDASGNSSTATFTITVVDTTPPDINVPSPSDITILAPTSDGATVSFPLPTAHDIVSGDLAEKASPGSGSDFSYGENWITFSATDKAGNTGYKSLSFVVPGTPPPVPPDHQPPSIAMDSPGDGQIFTNSAVTFTGAVYDDLGAKSVKVQVIANGTVVGNGQPDEGGNVTIVANIPDGHPSVLLRAIDAADQADSANANIWVDTLAPNNIAIDQLQGTSTAPSPSVFTSPGWITGTVQDPGDQPTGVAGVSVTSSGATTQTGIVTAANGNSYTWTAPIAFGATNGIVNTQVSTAVSVTANDAAGNSANRSCGLVNWAPIILQPGDNGKIAIQAGDEILVGMDPTSAQWVREDTGDASGDTKCDAAKITSAAGASVGSSGPLPLGAAARLKYASPGTQSLELSLTDEDGNPLKKSGTDGTGKDFWASVDVVKFGLTASDGISHQINVELDDVPNSTPAMIQTIVTTDDQSLSTVILTRPTKGTAPLTGSVTVKINPPGATKGFGNAKLWYDPNSTNVPPPSTPLTAAPDTGLIIDVSQIDPVAGKTLYIQGISRSPGGNDVALVAEFDPGSGYAWKKVCRQIVNVVVGDQSVDQPVSTVYQLEIATGNWITTLPDSVLSTWFIELDANQTGIVLLDSTKSDLSLLSEAPNASAGKKRYPFQKTLRILGTATDESDDVTLSVIKGTDPNAKTADYTILVYPLNMRQTVDTPPYGPVAAVGQQYGLLGHSGRLAALDDDNDLAGREIDFSRFQWGIEQETETTGTPFRVCVNLPQQNGKPIHPTPTSIRIEGYRPGFAMLSARLPNGQLLGQWEVATEPPVITAPDLTQVNTAAINANASAYESVIFDAPPNDLGALAWSNQTVPNSFGIPRPVSRVLQYLESHHRRAEFILSQLFNPDLGLDDPSALDWTDLSNTGFTRDQANSLLTVAYGSPTLQQGPKNRLLQRLDAFLLADNFDTKKKFRSLARMEMDAILLDILMQGVSIKFDKDNYVDYLAAGSNLDLDVNPGHNMLRATWDNPSRFLPEFWRSWRVQDLFANSGAPNWQLQHPYTRKLMEYMSIQRLQLALAMATQINLSDPTFSHLHVTIPDNSPQSSATYSPKIIVHSDLSWESEWILAAIPLNSTLYYKFSGQNLFNTHDCSRVTGHVDTSNTNNNLILIIPDNTGKTTFIPTSVWMTDIYVDSDVARTQQYQRERTLAVSLQEAWSLNASLGDLDRLAGWQQWQSATGPATGLAPWVGNNIAGKVGVTVLYIESFFGVESMYQALFGQDFVTNEELTIDQQCMSVLFAAVDVVTICIPTAKGLVKIDAVATEFAAEAGAKAQQAGVQQMAQEAIELGKDAAQKQLPQGASGALSSVTEASVEATDKAGTDALIDRAEQPFVGQEIGANVGTQAESLLPGQSLIDQGSHAALDVAETISRKTPLRALAEWSTKVKALLRAADSQYWNVDRLRQFVRNACFVAGTKVRMADGTLKSIEEIRTGEWVLSRDQNRIGFDRPSLVQETIHRVSDHIRVLKFIKFRSRTKHRVGESKSDVLSNTADDDDPEDIIRTTDEHPFYVLNFGWRAATTIRQGDVVVTSNNELAICESSVREDHSEGVTVYNLSVAVTHTYFVGQTSAWVHNTCERLVDFASYLEDSGANNIYRPGKIIKGFIVDELGNLVVSPDAMRLYQESIIDKGFLGFSRTTFRANLIRFLGITESQAKRLRVFEAHHVFPKQFADIFAKLGILVHDPQYGAIWHQLEHQAAHNIGKYNKLWEKFLENPHTYDEVIDEGKRLAKEFGFQWTPPIHP